MTRRLSFFGSPGVLNASSRSAGNVSLMPALPGRFAGVDGARGGAANVGTGDLSTEATAPGASSTDGRGGLEERESGTACELPA